MATDPGMPEANAAGPLEWDSEVAALLEQAQQILRDARRVPLTGLVLADADAITALLDHMREALPEDIRRARWIIGEQDRLLRDAEALAANTLAGADRRLAELVGETEVTRQAEQRAAVIVARAEEVARDTRQAARQYVDDLLARVERQAAEVAARLEANRAELRD